MRENPWLAMRRCGAIYSCDPEAVRAHLDSHPAHRDLPVFLWGRGFSPSIAVWLGGEIWEFWRGVDDGGGPREVVGPAGIVAGLEQLFHADNHPDAVVGSAATIAVALARANKLRDRTIWEIGAGASGGGLLAIGAAVGTMGPAVAVDPGQPGAFGPTVARVWGTRLRVILGVGPIPG
jgi:hypothetical protein